MLSPLLVIGVGGSGGKTIRAMKQALRRRLDRKRYEGPLPSAWQFLQIDTIHDGLNFPAPMLPAEEVHVVVPRGADYPMVRSQLEANAGQESKQRELLTGWTVDDVQVPIHQGAGMLRGIGRSVGINDVRGMYDAIQGAAGRLSSPSALTELQAVARALGISGEVKTRPRAILITSLSGGSGAGMFLDVAELLKKGTDGRADGQAWRNELMSFLYTPEVFSGLGPGTGDVNKNALGALNEIVSGNWSGATAATEEFLVRRGIASGSTIRNFLGSKGNILIGATNAEGIDISKGGDGLGMDEVFLTVGETLAGVFVDPDTTEALYDRILVNVSERNNIVDKSGLSAIRTEQIETGNKAALPFAGIGFARLTLGVDRTIDFVADAFTRAQVRRLLWPEDPREQAPPPGYTKQQWVAEKVDQMWRDFLSQSGVSERGSDDQVINALRPSQWRQSAQAAATRVVQAAAASDRPRELTQVAALTWNAWGSESKDIFEALRLQVNSACQAWVTAIQLRLRTRVADVVSAEGFNVALGLVDKLASEIRDGGASSLAKEAAEFQSAFNGVNAASWQTMVQEAAGGAAGLSVQNTDAWKKLHEKVVSAVELQLEALVRGLGSRLLSDLGENFLAPLRASLSDAHKELIRQASQETLDNGQKNPLGSFPDWHDSVPQRYRPRSIERTLVKPEDYRDLYESYALKDRQMADPFVTSFGLALRGQPLRDDEQVEQTLVAASRPWVPQVPEARNVGDSASKAMFTVASELLRRGELNRRWLTDTHSSFGKLAQQGIADFVHAGGDLQLQRERQSRFADAYAEMLRISQPLVKLNSAAMQQLVIGADDGLTPTRPQRESTKIPFANEGVIGQRCTAAWKSAGDDIADAGFEAKHFKPGSSVDELIAITATDGAYPAFAFASLTEPIAKAAATCVNNEQLWLKFWRHRRTRPLMEAIPLPRSAVRSIITGWFIAKSFDMVLEEPGEIGPRLSVWNPTLASPGRSAFPYPLLMASSGDVLRRWWLPSVLQSVGLAMVEIGQTGRQEPAHPYLLLQYLGREVTTKIAGTDTWAAPQGDKLPNGNASMCDFVQTWMQTGGFAVNGVWGAFTPAPRWASPTATDFNSRKNQLLARITDVENWHASQWAELEQMHWVVIPHYFELRSEIAQALSSMKQFVEQSVQAGATGSDMA